MAIPAIDYEQRTLAFETRDGMQLNLQNVRARGQSPRRGPVLLVHGAGVRANIFRAPVATNVVDALVEAGYDVWLENWRASIDVAPNAWTLDQAALFDHPEAVRTVLAETGASSLQAIVHCQGSTSFVMSAVAGLVPQVRTIISNAVSLHPVVPSWSHAKLKLAVPFVSSFTRFLNPGWGKTSPGVVPTTLNALVQGTHHECDNPVCKMVSFTYGSGRPALWEHANLNDETHATFIPQEFGHVPLSFFKQMARCVSAQHLVRYEDLPGLPLDYTDEPPQTSARFVFLTGTRNRCFLPESQTRSYQYFDAVRPGYHKLHVFEGYSHLDVFLGKNAKKDTFPSILRELDAVN